MWHKEARIRKLVNSSVQAHPLEQREWKTTGCKHGTKLGRAPCCSSSFLNVRLQKLACVSDRRPHAGWGSIPGFTRHHAEGAVEDAPPTAVIVISFWAESAQRPAGTARKQRMLGLQQLQASVEEPGLGQVPCISQIDPIMRLAQCLKQSQ